MSSQRRFANSYQPRRTARYRAVWCLVWLCASAATAAGADDATQPAERSEAGVFQLVGPPTDDGHADQPAAHAPPTDARAWPRLVLDARARAVEQVRASSTTADPYLRANAIEASLTDPTLAHPLVIAGLSDPEPVVRFAAAVGVGRLRLTAEAQRAQALLDDPSRGVRAAAIYALYRCGRPIDTTPLAGMLTGQDPSARGNAAMVLGMMDQPGAAEMLRDLAPTPMPRASAAQEAIVRLQVAEAIVRLGDDSALAAVRAAAYSQFDEVRVMAVSMMGQFGDRRMEKAMAAMLADPPIELQLAAAGSLAQLGRPEGLPVVLRAARADAPTVRSQAALTLAHFASAEAARQLVDLLADPEESVRLAAAAGVLRVAGDAPHPTAEPAAAPAQPKAPDPAAPPLPSPPATRPAPLPPEPAGLTPGPG